MKYCHECAARLLACTTSGEIDQIGEKETDCRRLMSIPGIGPLISTAVVAAIGTGEAFERGRDFGAWLGLI
jgi:transposase